MTYIDFFITKAGYKTAENIVVGDEVLTLDNEGGSYSFTKVVSKENIGEKQILYVKTEDAFIECTQDVIFYTVSGKKKGRDLMVGDLIIGNKFLQRVSEILGKGIQEAYKIKTEKGSMLVNTLLVG